MPYDETFRKHVCKIITELRSTNGKQYHRKIHTLDMIIQKYQYEMNIKYKNLGNTILTNMNKYITEIFQYLDNNSSYEILDFALCIIKWYFKTIIKRKNHNTNEIQIISLPDYTVPEIKELYNDITTSHI
jgi:hypothetical protein